MAQPTYVYPLVFLNSLYTAVETGSKCVAGLIGAVTGRGSYDTIVTWLKDQNGNPVEFLEGDIGNVFYNTQKICKTWSVQVNSKIKVSVITAHLWVQLENCK